MTMKCISRKLPQLPKQSLRQFRSITTVKSTPNSSNNANDTTTTHFGYETIPSSSKESRVGAVFTSVSSNYDTMNDLMSLGIHRIWKDAFVRSINPGSSTCTWKMLDIAGGTGDIAQRLLDHAEQINHDSSSTVIVSDINPDMLAEGKRRLSQTEYYRNGRVDFLEANAENLDMIEDDSMDLYTVAFGIRNFTNKEKALKEAYRVLKPGGVFACLEFGKIQQGIWGGYGLVDAVYKRWSFGMIPLIGQVVAGDRDSYQYLVESIDKFPRQDEFRDMISNAGFIIPRIGESGQGWINLSSGIAAIHKGIKKSTK